MSDYSDDQLVDLLLGLQARGGIEEAVRHEPELRRRCASLRADLSDLESELPELLRDGAGDIMARGSLRILLAVDGSRSRRKATLAAVALAQRSGGVVDVLHVREVQSCSRSAVVSESWSEAGAVLDPVLAELRDRDVMVRAQLRSASASRVAAQILCEAEEIAADIIVIGESSRSPLAVLRDVRVGAKVVRQAHCAVLVAH